MIRVCCTVGTWQLITLVASLRQADQEQAASGSPETHEDYLIAAEFVGVPEQFKQVLHQMAEAVWPWKRIIWAYDLLTSERHFTQHEFDRRRDLIKEKTGLSASEPSEIWACFVNRPPEKLVFSTFPAASLVLYEDGLTSYLPQELAARLDPARHASRAGRVRRRIWEAIEQVQPVWRFRRGKWNVDPQHLQRLTRAYYLLSRNPTPPELLAHVPAHLLYYDHVRDTLERAARVLPPDDLSVGSNDKFLVLGQALSRNRIISRAEELSLYQKTVNTVLSKGYDVLWKEHPRISEPFFDDLKTGAGRDAHRLTQLNVPHAFPIELLAPRLRLAGCAAGTSAALFYLKALYNLPCYTFASDVLPLLDGRDRFMGEMVARESPPLSELPDKIRVPVAEEATR